MIHEITEDIFNNQYKNTLPGDEDLILCFFEGKIYYRNVVDTILGDSNTDCSLGEIQFPKWREIKGLLPKEGIILKPTYVFSINYASYYIAIVQNRLCTEGTSLIESTDGLRFFRDAKPRIYAFAAMNAIHLKDWYINNRFCGRCGIEMELGKKERVIKCPNCGNAVYPRINPAILAVIINRGQTRSEDRILLTKYAARGINRFVLVAGFLEFGETLEECVQREVYEEVGLKVDNVCYVASQPWGFSQNIMIGYSCELQGEDKITLDMNELKTAAWFTREECLGRDDDDSSLTAWLIRKFKHGEL